MDLEDKRGNASNSRASKKPHKLNVQRFAHDVFVSVFIRLGVPDFPKSEHCANLYKDSELLGWVSMQVLSFQLSYRTKYKEMFSTLCNKYSFTQIDHFVEVVRQVLSENGHYKSDPKKRVSALFSVIIELFLYLQFREKSANLALLPRVWYKIYTKDVYKTFKDDISSLSLKSEEREALKDEIHLFDESLYYFLKKYFTPYGARNDCSNIYKIYWRLDPKKNLDLSTLTFKSIDDFVTGPLGAEFHSKRSNLIAHERLGIPPHELLIKVAFESLESSAVPETDSGVSPKERKPRLSKPYKVSNSYQEWKTSSQNQQAKD